MIGFSVRLAWREARGASRYFLYVLVCIALGVAAVVSIGLFSAALEETIVREARALLGGDVEVRLSHALSAQGGARLDALAAEAATVTHVTELIAMTAARDMIPGRPGSAPTQLVELKAVDGAYPLYGSIETRPRRDLTGLVERRACRVGSEGMCYGAVVQESLLLKLGLALGDHVKIGESWFAITAVLVHEPDRVASAFSLGPRVLISQDALHETRLVKPGSRVRERYLIRAEDGVPSEELVARLRDQLAADAPRVSSFRNAQPQLRRFLDQLARYLGLIGLTALFVGGIGIASTIHAYVKDKLLTIAILKTVGADSATIVRLYLLQAVALGIIGSLLGVAVGLSMHMAFPSLLARIVPADLVDVSLVQATVTWGPLLRGVALGVVTTVLCASWPVLVVRDVRPFDVFRRRVLAGPESGAGWRAAVHELLHDRLRLGTAVLLGCMLAGLAAWQARSPSIGLLFIGALGIAVVLLATGSRFLLRVLKAAPRPSSITARYATANLWRPGSQTVGVMVAIGIGVMMVTTVSLVERALIRQIGDSRPVNAPTFFFIDIQPDQREAFASLMARRWPEGQTEFTPLVRSRLQSIDGEPVSADADPSVKENDRGGERGKSWYRTREYVLTFLDRLPRDNAIVKGEWWPDGSRSGPALVSVEEEAARNLGLHIGSVLAFDIQGTVLSARVSSIRKVEWSNFSTNFYMILSPGSLDGAPFTYVATTRVLPDQEVAIQRAVVEEFPNVTAINIGEVMGTFAGLLERLALVIRVTAGFCIFAGAVVMAAALASTRYRRLYESAVLKAVGATRVLIAGSFAVEYALMGAVAGVVGVVLASAVAWATLTWIFDLSWNLQPLLLTLGVVLTVVLTLGVGFLATFRLLGQRPLAILRQE